jgi:4-hydroxythreonine-4-phosphate dehydrogenase
MKIKLNFKLGKPNASNSQFVLKSINESYRLIKKKQVSGMITLPVCKKTLKKYGFNFCGQTEYISNLASENFRERIKEIMILSTSKPADMGDNLIVGLVTTHVPLKKCLNLITKKILEEKIITFNDTLKKLWKISKPKIAIAAINPHAGEGGLIGKEEISIIKPVIKKISGKINVIGPFSGDSCFSKDVRSNYDGIICFYHDQGLIPIKLLDFYNSINVTGGLPFIRVSPDHGPAFDIANKNIADPSSLCSAIKFLKKNV